MLTPLMLTLLLIGAAALLLDGALLALGSPFIYTLGLPLRRGREELLIPLSQDLPREARGTQARWIGEGSVGYFTNMVRIGFSARGVGFLPGAFQRAICGMGVPASGLLSVSEDGQTVGYVEVLRLGPLILTLCLMGAGVLMVQGIPGLEQAEGLPVSAELLPWFPIPLFGLFTGFFALLGLFFLKRARRSLAGGSY